MHGCALNADGHSDGDEAGEDVENILHDGLRLGAAARNKRGGTVRSTHVMPEGYCMTNWDGGARLCRTAGSGGGTW